VADILSGGSLTVPEFARRYRIGQDRVRAMIARGELPALNTADVLCSNRPRWVITPEAAAAWERRRAGGPPPKTPRRRRPPIVKDFTAGW
jgi:hypothetical protein